MSRRFVREQIFQLLFQFDFTDPDGEEEQLELYFTDKPEIPLSDKDFITNELKGIKEHRTEIDELINQFSIGWKVNRMPKVDLAIIRLALYEIFYVEDIPTSVAINEAVELGKKFSADSAPAFINGLLGKIVTEKIKE